MHKEKIRNLYSFVILILFWGINTSFASDNSRDSIEAGVIHNLKNLQAEIEMNIEELKDLIYIIDENANALRKLSLLFSKEEFNLDTIINNSARMSLLLEFYPIKKAYDTIKSANSLPGEFMNAVELLYGEYEKIQKSDQANKIYIKENIITYLWENIDMINGRALNDAFYKTEYFRNILTDYLNIFSQQKEAYKKGLEMSNEVKEMLTEKD